MSNPPIFISLYAFCSLVISGKSNPFPVYITDKMIEILSITFSAMERKF